MVGAGTSSLSRFRKYMSWRFASLLLAAGCSALTAPEYGPPRVQAECPRETSRRGEERLTKPKWIVGSTCGIGEDPAPGRLEVENYIRYHREDALRQLLQDCEPAARVYGLLGLVQIGAISPDEFEVGMAAIPEEV